MFPKMTPIGCHYYFISDITHARHSMISNSSFCTSFYNPLVVFWCCHRVYPHLHGISGFSRDSLYVCNGRYYLIRHSHMPQLIKTLKCLVNFMASVHAQVPVISKCDCSSTSPKMMLNGHGPHEQLAFCTLKDLITSAPILTSSDNSRPFWIKVDSSDFATETVLSQQFKDDDKWQLVVFLSKSLSAVERNYEIHNKEMLAIIWAMEEWRHFLEVVLLQLELLFLLSW